MQVVNLKSQIISLVKLQDIDTEIYSLRSEKEAKPQEIKALEASFEEKKKGLAALEQASLDLQKKRKEKEGELAAQEENIKKLQAQLYTLKTNKEYATMLAQIEDAKADKSVIEDKILALFDQADKIKKDVESENAQLKEQEKLFLAETKKVEDRIREIDERLAQLDARRKQAIVEIDPAVLGQYERILANRDALAIVRVKASTCGGCNMLVPPQVLNLIKMYERLITCEVCNRILYIEDEAS